MAEIESILIQLRARLQERNIKLWEAPYYVENVGCNEAAVEELCQELSTELHISATSCKSSLLELQQHALRKLAARRQFDATGLATFQVRCVDSQGGTCHTLQLKCDLNEIGAHLQRQIAEQLQLSEAEAAHVKCISAGRLLTPQATLQSQGVRNNQQLLVIVGQSDATGEALYERIRHIQLDVEMVVDAQHRLVELEDQDGNAMFLPPDENRSLLLGMGLCEKGRAAMRREQYDEALLLFLEADERFGSCDSKFLESVDNYALLNLDIVWCYLCLKHIAQLPDAQRRLDLCERLFRRSYGENNSRLYALKGTSCPERALIMRLQLLQGVLLFHQNRRDEARLRLQAASAALVELRVNTEQLELLLDMGYEVADARLALRSCNGNVERSLEFIQQRRQRLQAARHSSDADRRLEQLQLSSGLQDWVHPRSVCRLMEMGYERSLVVEALRRTDNDLARSLDLLQSHSDELRRHLPATQPVNEQMLNTLCELGFKRPSARAALETTQNNMDRAIDFLLKSFASERELNTMIEFISKWSTEAFNDPTASTSMGQPAARLTASKLALVQSVLSKAKAEMVSFGAYKRFNEDLPSNEQDYLDLPLDQEQRILNEYQQLLEN
ncbi:NEDD8 ultimate buster 1 [Drosophila grimshawi]|uniref:GH18980 n=1 Tax=Drosophila grimshawi TaxID=7222 RepID=B4JHK8_DROGR|nr:NEDD8 ultimate buster 1 [Drosophila grimshawi]EDV92835.1 GH18980 [Drosophila grimshawi]